MSKSSAGFLIRVHALSACYAQVHLPASVPPHLMQELVVHSLQQLGLSEQQEQAVGQAEHQQLTALLERSGNSPALFTTMLELWADEETSVDITTFVGEFMTNKLFEEVSTQPACPFSLCGWWHSHAFNSARLPRRRLVST